MGKCSRLLGLVLSFGFFLLPLFAHADNKPQDLFYDVIGDVFYWGSTVSTPQFKTTNGGYGGNIDFRFRPNSGLDNFGFGVEYTSNTNGPVYNNTSGAFVGTAPSGTGGSQVSLGNGLFGFVSQGTYRMGGGKVKYFIPLHDPSLAAAVYADFFVSGNSTGVGSTSKWNAVGGGAEVTWRIANDFQVGGFADFNNNVANGFPAQTLVRYQTFVRYMIPSSHFHILAGYRGYNYYSFNTTYINGYILGAGLQW